MKKILCMLLLSFSAQSYAFFEDSVQVGQSALYSGSGSWQSDKPKLKGLKYTLQMLVTRVSLTENTVEQTYSSTKPDLMKNFTYRAIQKSPTSRFYNIFINNDLVCNGFCFALSTGKKCYYKMTVDGKEMHQMFTVKGTTIFRMGNYELPTGYQVIWHEGLADNPPMPFQFNDDLSNSTNSADDIDG